MNPLCECALAGWCERHKLHKSQRMVEHCKGQSDASDCGLKYWRAWEQGQIGATAPPHPVLNPEGFCQGKRTAPPPKVKKAASAKRGCVGCGGGQSLIAKGSKYAAAMWRWKREGSPVRSDQETAAIFHEQCKPCQYFKPEGEGGSCEQCGCRLSPSGGAMVNRIRMATESCPLPEPKWQATPAKARGSSGKFKKGPFAYRQGGTPEFVTMSRLMEDCKRLASLLPPDTSRIIGVARSGLTAANMVAMIMHRPVSAVRQSMGDLIELGNGWRLTGSIHSSGPAVLIDDTCMTGNSFKQVTPIVRKHFPNVLTAAVYVNPNANHKPDLWARDLPWPHLLEWNLFNSILCPGMAVDFDGILCHDCPPDDDDDGPRYARFLRDAKPLYLIRRTQVPLIVTARLEKYRAQTLDWLGRHGISVGALVMWPGANHRERTLEKVSQFKAEHYRRFLAKRHHIHPPLFVESDARQAERIAQLSRGLVVCPVAGRCFP